MPLAAVCGRAEVMNAPAPGGLGGTYAGNPLAVASALAVLDVIAEENLVVRGARLGAALKDFLIGLGATTPAIGEVRGLGAMVAVEFVQPGSDKPDAEFA
jgi:4-aminobutyrate aminotransferase-like enzyme